MGKLPYKTCNPRGCEIFLYDNRYNEHIKNRHPTVSIEAILETIEDPDIITQDINNPSGENYYARGVIPDAPNFFLKVCVHIETSNRKVVTAFELDRPKQKEQVIWRR